VATSETTPVWAHTVPVEPAENSSGVTDATGDDDAMPALPMQKGDPDWSKSQTSPNGDAAGTTPEWATAVPTAPDEPIPDIQASTATETAEPPTIEASTEPPESEAPAAEAPAAEAPVAEAAIAEAAIAEAAIAEAAIAEALVVEAPVAEPPAESPLTGPLRSVAGDAMKSTWPPASESAPAPPEETDIWPPEPPTERAMPAWPPPSELEEPATPAQVIPTWPDSFAPAAEQATLPAPAVKAVAPEPKAIAPEPKLVAPEPKPVAPEPKAEPSSTPPRSAVPTRAPQAEPEVPAKRGGESPPPRPAWAPGPKAEPVTSAPKVQGPDPMPVPAWAPRVPLAAEPGTPTWFSPKEEIPHTASQVAQPPPAPAPQPTPAPPAGTGKLPVAPIPASPASPAAPARSASAQSTWEVVEQKSKSGPHAKVEAGPTAEDRSYAEWFAWAKRGGAPASACHAAAQGAFKALSSGKDVATAVQWATAAMSRPPENVSYARQTYCAWFSLANIDLNLDQHRAHAFATAALQALDTGQDASAAHAAGLVAAGIK